MSRRTERPYKVDGAGELAPQRSPAFSSGSGAGTSQQGEPGGSAMSAAISRAAVSKSRAGLRGSLMFVVDEHAERLWLPQRHAAAIRAMLARHAVGLAVPSEPASSHLSYRSHPSPSRSLSRIVAGADVFSRQSDGTTIDAQYAREGITLRPANMDRVNGWAEVLQRFGDPEPQCGLAIPARLFIHRRCGRLVETVPALQHDPNRPEDVLKVDADEDGVGGDDAADALRYLVATRGRSIVERRLRGV